MFMDYETWVDKLCAAVMLVGGVVFLAWWFAVALPERDEKLFSIHHCYVERGCDELRGTPDTNTEARECWADCTNHARTQAEL